MFRFLRNALNCRPYDDEIGWDRYHWANNREYIHVFFLERPKKATKPKPAATRPAPKKATRAFSSTTSPFGAYTFGANPFGTGGGFGVFQSTEPQRKVHKHPYRWQYYDDKRPTKLTGPNNVGWHDYDVSGSGVGLLIHLHLGLFVRMMLQNIRGGVGDG